MGKGGVSLKMRRVRRRNRKKEREKRKLESVLEKKTEDSANKTTSTKRVKKNTAAD